MPGMYSHVRCTGQIILDDDGVVKCGLCGKPTDTQDTRHIGKFLCNNMVTKPSITDSPEVVFKTI